MSLTADRTYDDEYPGLWNIKPCCVSCSTSASNTWYQISLYTSDDTQTTHKSEKVNTIY